MISDQWTLDPRGSYVIVLDRTAILCALVEDFSLIIGEKNGPIEVLS